MYVKSFERNPPNIKFNEKIRQGRHGDDNRCVCATFCCVGAKTLLTKLVELFSRGNGANSGLFNWPLSSSPVIALPKQLLILSGDTVNVYL